MVGLDAPSPDEQIIIQIGVEPLPQLTLLATVPVTQQTTIRQVLARDTLELWKLQTVCTYFPPNDPDLGQFPVGACLDGATLHFSNKVLTQAITYFLAERVLDERLHYVQIASGWRPMLQGVWWLGRGTAATGLD